MNHNRQADIKYSLLLADGVRDDAGMKSTLKIPFLLDGRDIALTLAILHALACGRQPT